MINIKINETVIHNVHLTDNGDTLGVIFTTNMTLAELENLFDPKTSSDFYVMNDSEEIIGAYKNHKVININVDILEQHNVINLILQVIPVKLKEVELLTNQLNAQMARIEAQAQEINILKKSLDETNTALTLTQ